MKKLFTLWLISILISAFVGYSIGVSKKSMSECIHPATLKGCELSANSVNEQLKICEKVLVHFNLVHVYIKVIEQYFNKGEKNE